MNSRVFPGAGLAGVCSAAALIAFAPNAMAQDYSETNPDERSPEYQTTPDSDTSPDYQRSPDYETLPDTEPDPEYQRTPSYETYEPSDDPDEPGTDVGFGYHDYRPEETPQRQSVFADDMDDPYRPNTLTPFGMSLALGGGVTGFTDPEVRDFSEIGGGWDARFVMGTRNIIGGEIAYIGSSRDVTALGLDDSAFLQAHGGEIAARLHLLPGLIQPYVLAGAGFNRYTLTNDDFNTSSISNEETVAHFPLGAGAALRYEGFVADARGVFRPTVRGNVFSEESEMHSWGANLSLGAEF